MVSKMSRQSQAGRIIAGLLPAPQVRREHALCAEAAGYRRVEQSASREEKLVDWIAAGYGAQIAARVLRALTASGVKGAPATDVELSEAVALELRSTGVEECKALLAWLHWEECGATVDSSISRIRGDWSWACGVFEEALRGPPPAARQDSVRSWVEQHYVSGRVQTIHEKAYCHWLGHSWGEKDYAGATSYVDGFAALAGKAVSAGATASEYDALVRFLLKSDNWQWEDSMEMLLPHVRAINGNSRTPETVSAGDSALLTSPPNAMSHATGPSYTHLGSLPDDLVLWEHYCRAILCLFRRHTGREPNSEVIAADYWPSAGYGSAKATEILRELMRLQGKGSPETDVELSEAVAIELHSTGVEECHALLAWLHWKESGGNIDSDLTRIRGDWSWAFGVLKEALGGPPPADRQDSVRAWVEQHYLTSRVQTIREKAFCHSLGRHSGGADRDYAGATSYVDRFAALAGKAVSAGATASDYDALVRFLFESDNWQWEDAMELLLPHVWAVEPREFEA